jgi:uncharacterized protein
MSAAEKAETKPTGANHNLWQIAKMGDVDQLERALARGADVNACNNLGLTPLMMAAYHGQTDMVKALVEHGADVNAFDNRGLRAAMLAKDSGHAEILRTLVARGVERSPTAPQSEASAVRFAKSESVDTSDDLAEVSKTKDAEVRTLKEPPEIWDLVHEAPPDFKLSSTFAEHLVRLHPLILAGILVVIGCGVGFLYAALGTRTNTASLAPQNDHNAASLPLTSDRTNAKSPLNPESTLSGRTPSAIQGPTTPTLTNPVSDTLDALRNIDGGVAGESLGRPNHDSFEIEASGDGARSSSLSSSKRSVTLSKNKRRAALVRQSENENEATRTVLQPAEKVPSPESISPAKPDPTPKPKVIPWP